MHGFSYLALHVQANRKCKQLLFIRILQTCRTRASKRSLILPELRRGTTTTLKAVDELLPHCPYPEMAEGNFEKQFLPLLILRKLDFLVPKCTDDCDVSTYVESMKIDEHLPACRRHHLHLVMARQHASRSRKEGDSRLSQTETRRRA